jgi:signal transduction histidine kinase
MDILRVLVGVAMLTLGQKLFWLFVGGIGFVYGIHIAAEFFYGQPAWIVIVIALLAGLLGSLIALFLQNVAVWLAGLSAGSYFLVTLLNVFGWNDSRLYWLSFLVGGIIGAVLMAAVFDWALIILSSMTGALLITQSIQFTPQITALSFSVLFIVGLIVQASLMIKEEPEPTSSEPSNKSS